MRTENPIYAMYSAEEKQFLERMFVTYPKIGENFDRYLTAAPMQRMFLLQQDMKALKRAGWVRRAVEDPESDAAHSVTAARIALLFAPENVDKSTIGTMLIVHDAPEVIVGDFTPHDDITPEDKHRLEDLAARAIFQMDPALLALVEEYNAQETPTSHWAHDIDKLDAVLTALAYEHRQAQQKGKLYDAFANYTKPKLKTENGKKLMELIETQPEMLLPLIDIKFKPYRQVWER